jgi:hypothetical protein
MKYKFICPKCKCECKMQFVGRVIPLLPKLWRVEGRLSGLSNSCKVVCRIKRNVVCGSPSSAEDQERRCN